MTPAAPARERLEVDVTEVAYGPSALGRTGEGQVVFVDDALPGERVVAEVASRKRNYLNTRAVEVLTASPKRVVPPCPYVPDCGGCQWQHASCGAPGYRLPQRNRSPPTGPFATA